MTREEVWQCISEIGIVPAVTASSPALAVAVARAIRAGGIPIVEIVMTMVGAIEVIEELSGTMDGQMVIGAGAVVGAETAARCLNAGADFLVSPGFDTETVKLANLQEKLIMAGALTPTEVVNAWKAGSDFVKIFPCGSVGGANYIRALKTAFPYIPMVPSGGVSADSAADFLHAGASALGIGDLISVSALDSGTLPAITDGARRYVAAVSGVRKSNGSGAAAAK